MRRPPRPESHSEPSQIPGAIHTGITSTMRSSRRHRQRGAPGVVSSASPRPRSRSASAVYFEYEATSTIASTSLVGRIPPAAESVMNRPVVHPPTNTSSSSSGASNRTTDSNSARFGSATEESPKSSAESRARRLRGHSTRRTASASARSRARARAAGPHAVRTLHLRRLARPPVRHCRAIPSRASADRRGRADCHAEGRIDRAFWLSVADEARRESPLRQYRKPASSRQATVGSGGMVLGGHRSSCPRPGTGGLTDGGSSPENYCHSAGNLLGTLPYCVTASTSVLSTSIGIGEV